MDPEAPQTDPTEQAMADDGVRAFVNDRTLDDGRRIRLVVPYEFDADLFEVAVSMLFELRIHAEQAKARDETGPAADLLVPNPKLVGLDGKALS